MRRLPLLLLVVACARAASPSPEVTPQGAAAWTADASRCASLADSTSRVSLMKLPLAVSAPVGRLDAYPRDARDRMVVRVAYRIGPEGRGDAASITIAGSTDPDFHAAVTRAVAQLRGVPARRDGCPVWSRGEMMLKAETRVRRVGG